MVSCLITRKSSFCRPLGVRTPCRDFADDASRYMSGLFIWKLYQSKALSNVEGPRVSLGLKGKFSLDASDAIN